MSDEKRGRCANSAVYWLPRIAAAGLPVPETRIVPYEHRRAVMGLEGDGDYRLPVDEVLQAAKELGPRVFIRGDQTSGKHSGPALYRFDADKQGHDDLARLLWRNVEDAEMKLWLSRSVQEAFLVRRWLDLESSFGAFGYGSEEPHPIAREFRFFADDVSVICHQPYWPEGAIEDDLGDGDWKQKLAHLNRPLSAAEYDALGTMAVEAARACPGAKSWSVDFAQDVHGKFWLIDMAVAAASYHDEACPHRGSPRIVGEREPVVAA